VSSTLETVAAQLADKACDVLTGPVRGTITTTATADTTVPIGQIATLPDGRRVRVIKRTIVGTSATAVPVRLEILAPASAAAGNFRAVALDTVATWVSPPTNLATTGTTSAFSSGTYAGALKIASFTEHDTASSPPEVFAAGTQGTASLVLISPTVRRIGPDNITSRGLYEATWPLRLVLFDVGDERVRRTRVRNAFDAIIAALEGTAAGDDLVRITAWTPSQQTGWGVGAWDATVVTRLEVEGRTIREAASEEAFEGADISVLIPEDADQPSPFRVLDSADT
jgi:hypothetical protein